MSSKQESLMKEHERLKYEAAQRLGLIDKLLDVGWGGLTAEETGRIGGMVGKMSRH